MFFVFSCSMFLPFCFCFSFFSNFFEYFLRNCFCLSAGWFRCSGCLCCFLDSSCQCCYCLFDVFGSFQSDVAVYFALKYYFLFLSKFAIWWFGLLSSIGLFLYSIIMGVWLELSSRLGVIFSLFVFSPLVTAKSSRLGFLFGLSASMSVYLWIIYWGYCF